ncbi:zinc ribbon domain-containing protein [Clostridium sp. P21]|uniref:Zinc ribbon domain-containing protein n=1 Tax=Clostridium muellerianum TaxID=2716538 RepID=A0A7Y0HNH6_9CLOT|nr:zinc ribbon domain-containing protein [Clostridium muellerianum]NMM63165.1 zinc ribbon domain-containing protein [Clostridium muellerianum]
MKMLFKPVSGAKQFVQNSEKSSVIGLTIFLVIIQGILGMWKVNQVISTIQSIALDLVQKISNIANLIIPGSSGKMLSTNDIMDLTGEMSKVRSLINIPYGKVFLQNSAVFLCAIITLFIIIYLGTTILSKDKKDPFVVYKASLIVLVPTLYFEIFSILFSYVLFYIGAGVFLIGVIVSLACLTVIIREELFVDENHTVFIIAVSFLGIFIIVSMCMQKFLVSNISDIIMSVTNVMKNVRF